MCRYDRNGGNWFIITQLPRGCDGHNLQSPIFTALLARVLLKEKLSWPQVGLLGMSVVGVLLVARPAFWGLKMILNPEDARCPRSVVIIGLIAAGAAGTNILAETLGRPRNDHSDLAHDGRPDRANAAGVCVAGAQVAEGVSNR